jgi:tRNA pseudouridine38-40 synthase
VFSRSSKIASGLISRNPVQSDVIPLKIQCQTVIDADSPELRRPPEGWRRLRLSLEYDGTDFAGWQVQSKGERTVQATLEAALMPLGPFSRPIAAGRTDAGVHALEMPVHVDVQHAIPIRNVLLALNARLPADVRVLQVVDAPEGFHARFSCRWRTYRYKIHNASVSSALERHRVLWVPQKLDLEAMNDASRHLLGAHDFAAFASREERQTVREVYSAEWISNPQYPLEFHIVGESFLRHMVRGIVGTLLDVGMNKLEPDDVKRILESRARSNAGPNVVPHGLYFAGAGYEAWSS